MTVTGTVTLMVPRRIGFLHTAAVHIATFDALVAELAPGTVTAHVVDESLLADARASGAIGDDLNARIFGRVCQAAAECDAVVCTCSTISGAAEGAWGARLPTLVRIDRPLVETALGIGRRVAVLAAVESTLGPTAVLVQEVAHQRGVEVDLRLTCVPGAWEQFEAGDIDAYLKIIASAVDSVSPADSDVVVLAQASMAGAALLSTTTLPVLSSPRLAVVAALAAADSQSH
jgi:hypothetical protein